MKEITVGSPCGFAGLMEGPLTLQFRNLVTISVVMYEHREGIPARFFAGLVPALKLAESCELKRHFVTTIRVIDPTSIVNHCNGWSVHSSRMQEFVRQFLAARYQGERHAPPLFFDEAEPVGEAMLKVFRELGAELESAEGKVRDAVVRLKESGRRHGGENGEKNAFLYMAAHPFSWLNFYHPAVWRKRPSPHCQLINLMSKSEEPFSAVRKFLRQKRPDLVAKVQPVDRYMAVCEHPPYIPLDGEPLCEEVFTKGYGSCLEQYRSLAERGRKYKKALRDFEMLTRFVEDTNH
ncbi:MAG: hypothetical protein HYY10_01700 [Candidatus Liptonbacteria bacterium]|nr:hypothetical protein [Candidatus Liptonbacteria bacterium]